MYLTIPPHQLSVDQILPNKTEEFVIAKNYILLKTKTAIFQFLFVYKNETGQLYGTEVRMVCNIRLKEKDEQWPMSIRVDNILSIEHIKPVYHPVYNIEQKKNILAKIEYEKNRRGF